MPLLTDFACLFLLLLCCRAGTCFEKIAESLSACDSKATGGDLGWIAPGLMVPEFDLVAFNFPPGELTALQTEFGWHVVRVAEQSFVAPEMQPAELKQRITDGDATAAPPTLQLIDLRDDEELAQAPLLPGFRSLQCTPARITRRTCDSSHSSKFNRCRLKPEALKRTLPPYPCSAPSLADAAP